MKHQYLLPFFSGLVRIFVVVCASFTLSACTSNSFIKRSEHAQMLSPAMKKVMSYSVYTPPDWEPSESLPLMILLHGAKDDHQTFDRYAVGQVLDKHINQNHAPRMIILSPDGEFGFWENWHDGSRLYRDWVVKDLMPLVQKQYNTKACPEYCYVSGISMGGHGALRFAYYEPETFSSAAVISAPIISKLRPGKTSLGTLIMKWFLPLERIWGDIDAEPNHIPKDLDPYISWVQKPELVNMPLLLVWGDNENDNITSSNVNFQQHLEDNAKQHSWFVYEGAHKWIHWREIMPEVLHFHFGTLKAAPE